MKKLIIASVALTCLTGCWWSSTGWDDAKERTACESANPGDPDKARACYETAKVAYDRDLVKQRNDLMNK